MKQTTDKANSAFVGAALDMSWRLAVVVLVPVIGGHLLDEQFESSPIGVIIGFIVALFGMVVVMRQTVRAVTEAGVDLTKPYTTPSLPDDDDDEYQPVTKQPKRQKGPKS